MSVVNLHLGDCMEAMVKMPDKSYDLAIVDTEYGINVNMNAGRKKDTKSKKRTIKKWDKEPPTDEYFKELFRVSLNQIIWGANHLIDRIKINKQGWIFWDKCVAPNCSFSDGELAWTSFNQSLKKVIIPWSGFIGMEGEKFHPTTKPIKLYKWLLKNYTKPGDKILDTHGGSMSIAIACYEMGFDLDLWEIDPDYYKDGKARFEKFKQKCDNSLFTNQVENGKVIMKPNKLFQ
jgi:site-specific DNA-methyltransferase (adenine-specific)